MDLQVLVWVLLTVNLCLVGLLFVRSITYEKSLLTFARIVSLFATRQLIPANPAPSPEELQLRNAINDEINREPVSMADVLRSTAARVNRGVSVISSFNPNQASAAIRAAAKPQPVDPAQS